MASILRYRVAMSGSGITGPGLVTFYAENAAGFPAAVQAFLFSQNVNFPGGVTFTYTNGGDSIDDVTGQINGTWSVGTAPSPHTGTGAGVYVAGTGMHVDWKTSTVLNGRRVRGRTFLVPFVSSAFTSAGVPLAGAVASLNSAAATLISSVPTLSVFSRPKVDKVTGAVLRPGSHAVITSASASPAASWLRSRRT